MTWLGQKPGDILGEQEEQLVQVVKETDVPLLNPYNVDLASQAQTAIQ